MKKFLAVCFLLLVVGYAYWPYYVVSDLSEAIRLADQKRLEKYIDFPAVRASMKAQILASIAKRNAAHPSLVTPEKQAFAEEALAKKLEADFTAEQLASFMLAKRKSGNAESTSELSRPTWTGLNTCSAESGKTKMQLRLSGLDGWKVVNIDWNFDSIPAPKTP